MLQGSATKLWQITTKRYGQKHGEQHVVRARVFPGFSLKVPACCSLLPTLPFAVCYLWRQRRRNSSIGRYPEKKRGERKHFYMLARTQQCVWWMAVELPSWAPPAAPSHFPRFQSVCWFARVNRGTGDNEPEKRRNELLKWQFKWLSTWSADTGDRRGEGSCCLPDARIKAQRQTHSHPK